MWKFGWTETSKKQLFLRAKQHFYTFITLFCTFHCRSVTTTTWNDQILSWLENGNGKAINFTISLWTKTWSPLFSSNLTGLLSWKQVSWYKSKIVSKDAKSIFLATFSLASPFGRIVKSLFLSRWRVLCSSSQIITEPNNISHRLPTRSAQIL